MRNSLLLVLLLSGAPSLSHALDVSSADIADLKLGMTEQKVTDLLKSKGYRPSNIPIIKIGEYGHTLRWEKKTNGKGKDEFGVHMNGVPLKAEKITRTVSAIGEKFDHTEMCAKLVNKFGEPTAGRTQKDGCDYQWAVINNTLVKPNGSIGPCVIFNPGNRCSLFVEASVTDAKLYMFIYSPEQSTQNAEEVKREKAAMEAERKSKLPKANYGL